MYSFTLSTVTANEKIIRTFVFFTVVYTNNSYNNGRSHYFVQPMYTAFSIQFLLNMMFSHFLTPLYSLWARNWSRGISSLNALWERTGGYQTSLETVNTWGSCAEHLAVSSHLNHKTEINQVSHTSTKCESPHIIMFTCFMFISSFNRFIMQDNQKHKSMSSRQIWEQLRCKPCQSQPCLPRHSFMLDRKRPACL